MTINPRTPADFSPYAAYPREEWATLRADMPMPLSDAELARLLAQQGLRVARRTITKYRALMRLPSVDVRRADLRR